MPGFVSAQSSHDLAYHLATYQVKEENQAQAFFDQELKPPQALISEFQWILDGLQNRCLNPLDTLGTTILETWGKYNQVKKSKTLLEVAHDLYQASRNTILFGTERVNFIMISEFWLISQLSGHTLEDVIASYQASKK